MVPKGMESIMEVTIFLKSEPSILIGGVKPGSVPSKYASSHWTVCVKTGKWGRSTASSLIVERLYFWPSNHSHVRCSPSPAHGHGAQG